MNIKKLVAVVLTCATVITGLCNLGCKSNLIAFAKDPVEKRTLTQENVQSLMTDPNVVFEGINEKVFKIPQGFTEIGECAFKYCIDLTEVIIPDGVTKIGVRAFWNCEHLEKVSIPSSVDEIGKEAFMMCKSLKQVTVPERVKKIEEGTFECCSSLTEVKILGNIVKFGNSAFSYCERLAKFEIPSSVTEIGGWAFNDCKGLKKIEIPDKIIKIKEGTFCGCNNLTKVTICGNILEFGKGAFYGCKSLMEVTIPKNFKKILRNAFGGCTSLKYITTTNEEKIKGTKKISIKSQGIIVPTSVNNFEPGCIVSCTDLKTIELLGYEIHLGEVCPYDCNNLSLVSFPNAKKLIFKNLGFTRNMDKKFSLFVPAGCSVIKKPK